MAGAEETPAGSVATTEASAAQPFVDDGPDKLAHMDSGERRLMELGYGQELERSLNYWEILNAAFNSGVVMAGWIPYFALMYANGGPGASIWFFVGVSCFVTIMNMSLAEIASSLPTAGSLYFWAAYLSPPKWRAFISFATGFVEFIGEAVTGASVALAGTQVIQIVVYTWPGVENPVLLTNPQLLGIVAAMLLCCGGVLLLPTKWIGRYLSFAGTYQLFMVVGTTIALPIIAPATQPASWVFGHFETLYDFTLVPNGAYAFVLTNLMAQYTLYAFDSASHVAEEAQEGDKSAPFAIVGGGIMSMFFGFGLLVATMFSIQGDTTGGGSLTATDTVTGGTNFVFQILYDCFYGRFGNGIGANICFLLYFVVFFNCTTALLLPSARTGYALARDKGLPFSNFFGHLNSWKVPAAAVMLTTVVAIVSCLLLLISTVAFYALAGTATALWFMCYCVPITLRLFTPEDEFQAGPFSLKKLFGPIGAKMVHATALIYCVYTVIVFNLPTTFPVAQNTFNYAPLGIGITFFLLLVWWFANARFWYKGPHIPERKPTKEVA